MDNKYSFINEEKAREQFEKFMKGIYDEIDELSVEVSSDLFDAFDKLTNDDADKSLDSKNKFFIPTFTDVSLSYSQKMNELNELENSLDSYNYKDLKALARSYNVKGYNSMRRDLLTMEIGKAINKVKESLTEGYNSSNNSYKMTMKAEFPGIKKYVSEKIVDIKYLLESVNNDDKKEYYSKLLQLFSNLENDITLFDRFKKDHEETLKLIKYTQEELDRVDRLIMFEEHKLSNAEDSLSKLVIYNNIKGLKAQKDVHLNNINRYQSNIANLFGKYDKYLSPTSCKESIISKIESIDILMKEAAIDGIIDFDGELFKQDRKNLRDSKNEVEKAFENATEKETKLNNLLNEYGLSKVKDNSSEKNIVKEDRTEEKTELVEDITENQAEEVVLEEPVKEEETIAEENIEVPAQEEIKEETIEEEPKYFSGYVSFNEPTLSSDSHEDKEETNEDIVDESQSEEEIAEKENVDEEKKEDVKENKEPEYPGFIDPELQKRIDSIEVPELVEKNYHYSVFADADEVKEINEEQNNDDSLQLPGGGFDSPEQSESESSLNEKLSNIGSEIKTNVELGASTIKNGAINAANTIKNGAINVKDSFNIVKDKIKENYESTSDKRAEALNHITDNAHKTGAKLKVASKKALTPAIWVKEKSKALLAAASHKIYKWASEDVHNAVVEDAVTKYINS